LINSINFTLS